MRRTRLTMLIIWILVFIAIISLVFAAITEYKTDTAAKNDFGGHGWFAKYIPDVNLTAANHIVVRWLNAVATGKDINITVGCMGNTPAWSIGNEYVTAGPFTQNNNVENTYNFTDVSNLTNQDCKVVFRIDSINDGVDTIRIGYDSAAETGAYESWYHHVPITNYTNQYRWDMSINVSQGEPPDITLPTNSTWNITSTNLIPGVNSTRWDDGLLISIFNDSLIFNVSTDEDANGSCRLDTEGNHTENLAADANYKLLRNDTTSHYFSVYNTIAIGNHCLYCSWIDASGNEPASGKSSSGCLNVTRWADSCPSVGAAAGGQPIIVSDTGWLK